MYGLAVMLTIPTQTNSKNTDKIHIIWFIKKIKAILDLRLKENDLEDNIFSIEFGNSGHSGQGWHRSLQTK